MATMFPQLAKDTVHIGLGAGKWIEVKMLPVSAYAKFRDIQQHVATLNDAMPIAEKMKLADEATAELAAMARSVLPEELHERLGRFGYGELSALVLVLCTGNDDSEKDDPQKKMTLPSQLRM